METMRRGWASDAIVWFQLEHQPNRLQALEVYASELVSTYTIAWFGNGGFVEVLKP